MTDIERRQERLAHNCNQIEHLPAEHQCGIMYEIILDCRFLRVKVTDYLVPKTIQNTHILPKSIDEQCPYCSTTSKNMQGLRAHVSVKHREQFEEWKNQQ